MRSPLCPASRQMAMHTALVPCKPLRIGSISRRSRVAVSCSMSNCLLRATAGAAVILTSCALTAEPSRAESASIAQTTVRTDTRKSGGIKLLESLNYKTLQLLSLPTYGKLAALVMVGSPLLFGGAYLYRRASGDTWEDSVMKTYFVLNNVPGTDITSEDSKTAVVVLNLVHIASVFTFAVLVGVLADDISGAVENARQGNWKLLTSQSDKGSKEGLPLVVLFNPDSPGSASREEVDEMLAEQVGNKFGADVVTREGSSTSLEDLSRVSAGLAKTIIVFDESQQHAHHDQEGAGQDAGPDHVDEVSSSSNLLATLAALHTAAEPGNTQRIILALGNEYSSGNTAEPGAAATSSVVAAFPAGSAITKLMAAQDQHVTAVTGMRDVHDMLAHTVFNPGLSSVFATVCMSGTGHDFYVRNEPSLAGKTFQEASHFFKDAVLCGVVDTAAGVARLNPDRGHIIDATEQLVLLASSYGKTGMSAASSQDNGSKLDGLEQQRQSKTKSKKCVSSPTPHIVLLAPEGADLATQMLASLADASQGRAVLTLVGKCPAQYRHTVEAGLRQARWAGCEVKWIDQSCTSASGLAAAGVASADAVVVAPGAASSSSSSDAVAQDAQVVSCAMHVLDVVMRQGSPSQRNNTSHTSTSSSPLRLVCSIESEQTKDILNNLCTSAAGITGDTARCLVSEALLESQLTTGMLGQVSVEPLLQPVFQELLDQGGAELYCKVPQLFGLEPGMEMTWGQVRSQVQGHNAVAIGIMTSGTEAQLGLSSDAAITLGDQDRIIVLADS